MKVEQEFELIVDWLEKNIGPVIKDNWTSVIGKGWFLQSEAQCIGDGVDDEYWIVEISDKKKEMIFALTFC